jgi:hypothetical protein
MSKQPLFSLAGLVGAVLALSVLGCRNDDRTNRPDELESPPPTPAPSDVSPPLIEDEDGVGDQDEVDHDVDDARGSLREAPPAGEDEVSPVDPDMPEVMVPPPSGSPKAEVASI